MTERRVNLRLAAVGGDKLKADLVSIGKEGRQALQVIEAGGPGASAGLNMTGAAATELMGRLEMLASKAARAAANMNQMAGAGSTVARINAATGVSSGVSRDAEDIAAYGRALDQTRAKYNPMFAAISRYRSELAEVRQAHAVGAISADEMTAAISRLRQASLQEIGVIKGRVQGYQAMEKQGGLARFQMVQLGYQLNDIGVSLASGQNPFVVMVQQGAQIAQIYGGQGGVRAMFSQIGGLIRGLPGPLKAVGIAAAIGAVGVAGLTHEINKASAVQVTFGDTAKAVWEVFADGVSNIAAPALQALAPVASTVWDMIVQGTALGINVIVGYWRTLGEIVRTVFAAFVPELTAVWNTVVSGVQWVVDTISGLFGWVAGSVGGDAATLAGWFTSAWEIIASGASDVGNAIINGFKIAFDAIGTLFSTLPSMVGAAVVAAANAVLAAIEALVVKATATIQSLLDSVGGLIAKVPGMEGFAFGKIGAPPALGRIENTFADDTAAAWKGFADRSAATWQKDNFAGFGERVGDIWDDDPAGDLYDSIKSEAEQNARERLEAEKKKEKGGRKGGGGASQEKSEVDELIKSLEREMAVLKETDPIKKQMLEYSKQLAGATEAQKRQVLELVEALDQEKNGWNAIGRTLQEYAEEASRIGDDIGKALVSAFQSAEDAVGEFVKTGKFDIRELITSIIADFAKLGARKFIFGPLSDALGGWMSNMGGGWLSAAFNHTGGAAGFGPTRQVHAAAFIGAPRLHSGTPLGLRSDEYAAILQRGERVLNRAQTREWETSRMGGAAPVINFNGVRDVQSFRQSRTQIAADLYRAMGMARRGM